MKKIICLTCCFVFAGVGSYSGYKLSGNDDNPKSFNSSDSSINGDDEAVVLKRAGSKNINGTYAVKRQEKELNSTGYAIDPIAYQNLRRKSNILEKLNKKYYRNPNKFLQDLDVYLKEKKDKSENANVHLNNLIHILLSCNFFCDSWRKEDVEKVEKHSYIKKRGLRCDYSL